MTIKKEVRGLVDQWLIDHPSQFCTGNDTKVLLKHLKDHQPEKTDKQLEVQIQGAKHERLIRNVFGGITSNELIAQGEDGTPFYSERSEPFSFLSVPVKDVGNLEDALKYGLLARVLWLPPPHVVRVSRACVCVQAGDCW